MVSAALLHDMAEKRIDVDLSLAILEDFNSGRFDSVQPVHAAGVPSIDGKSVIDFRHKAEQDIIFSHPSDSAKKNLARRGLSLPSEGLREFDQGGKKTIGFTSGALQAIGLALLPFTAYGVLNGGSATSYADTKKNQALGKDVFSALSPWFEEMAKGCRDTPKGLTPAYINPDGTAGASFLELKMRMRLVMAQKYGPNKAAEGGGRASRADFMPLFQMTSVGNDSRLATAYKEMSSSPLLSPLSENLGLAACAWETGIQPMIAAYTHSSLGKPKRIFDRAFGKEDSALALPGGHGQSFRVLSRVFQNLRSRGIRYACLGNVDNMAFYPDPRELAVLAVSGMPAGFDFSFRTAVDVKGGILVETENDSSPGGPRRRTVADIGPAIGFDEVLALEQSGADILFNCASGIFDLDYLVDNIDDISRRLPVRFTDQNKDSGKYSQAEQVAWEVTGLLPAFAAFAVEKSERFLAAKLLVETLLTSGLGLSDQRLPEGIRAVSRNLHSGFERLMRDVYAMELRNGRWAPTL